MNILKNLFFLILSIICIQDSFAQKNISVTLGEETSVPEGCKFTFLGESPEGNGYLVRTYWDYHIYIEKFSNSELAIDKSTKVDFILTKKSFNNDEADFEGAFLIEKGLVVFASHFDKERKLFNLFARTYDHDCQATSDWVLFETVANEEKSNLGDFTFRTSSDKSLLLVKYAFKNEIDKPLQFVYCCYNVKLEKIYKKEISFEKDEIGDGVLVYDDKILNNGSVAFFVRYNNKISFCGFSAEAVQQLERDDLNRYDIKFEKKSIVSMTHFEDKEGHIMLVGFYGEKLSDKQTNGIDGVAYVKLSQNGFKEVFAKASAFSDEFLLNFKSTSSGEDNSSIPKTYVLQNLLFNDKGEVTLIAQNIYKKFQSGFGSINEVLHLDQLIVIGINADGTLRYDRLIKKFSESQILFDGRQSYSVISVNNKIIIFYNDHFKNYLSGNEEIRSLPGYKKTVLVSATVDFDGNVSKKVVLRHKNVKQSIYTRYSSKVSGGNGILLVGYHKGMMRLIRFDVKENE